MDWILEHIRVLIVVGGAIAYWLNQRKKAREAAEAERSLPAQPVQAPASQLNEEAERVRRIQEEIRRKILQRTSGGAAPARPQPPPELPEPVMAKPRAQEREDAYSLSRDDSTELASREKALLEQQQDPLARMRDLEANRRQSSSRKAEAFAEKTTAALGSAAAEKGSLLADLRNTSSVRRAVILREILGTPVGLR
jgi:hypothetical protein